MTEPMVHVIDDDFGVRRALKRLLYSKGIRTESYPSAIRFLARPLPPGPACVLLDLRLPTMNGIELQELLRKHNDTISIIFISAHADIATSVRAIRGGAIDFLTKPFDRDQLLRAIDLALASSRQACEAREARESARDSFAELTPREQQVGVRVADGMMNKEIGFEFGTSEKTIKVQRGRVMQKLKLRTVAELVRFVDRLRNADRLFPRHEGWVASTTENSPKQALNA